MENELLLLVFLSARKEMDRWENLNGIRVAYVGSQIAEQLGNQKEIATFKIKFSRQLQPNEIDFWNGDHNVFRRLILPEEQIATAAADIINETIDRLAVIGLTIDSCKWTDCGRHEIVFSHPWEH